MAVTNEDRSLLTTLLLACGILSSVIYVGTELFASLTYPGYSWASQMVSELAAIGAPTRPLWMAMGLVYNPLVVAFGVGVWRAARGKLSLRLTGAFLVAYGVVSGIGPYVPMQQRGSGIALTDVLHIADTVGMIVFMLLFVAFGANASGRRFRLYSIATLVALVGGGILAGMAGGNVAGGGATPLFGLLERVNIYAEMLWVLVLGVTLLRGRTGRYDTATARTSPARG